MRRAWRSFAAAIAALALVASPLVGCAHTAVSVFQPREPLWRDDDRRPFAGKLRPYYSPHDWDRIEKSFVLPLSDFLAVRAPSEAINVNALDEVPDSSWFENRLGRFPLAPEDAARGPCITQVIDGTSEPWLVVGAKPDGSTPGFVFEARGQRYLAKVDGASGSPRASVADVLGSRIYHAAGYRVPCNVIAHFDPSILRIEQGAQAEDEAGDEVPLTQYHLDSVLSKALRRADGHVRVLLSAYLDGRPLGPWRYHGARPGDRNDIIRHEDRRELRGSRLLAAWTDHVDQREGNTLSMWREVGAGRGYVMHHLLDFGDCFGSVWGGPVQEARRRGYDYWLDPRSILAEFFTLGVAQRPWDRASLGQFGLWLGFYDVDLFEPQGWRPRYPNPAFVRMTERDGAWMARIIARLTPRHVERMLDEAQAPSAYRQELSRIVLGRREKILRRYLLRLSPLADPTFRAGPEGQWLCATDLSVSAGIAAPQPYRAHFVGDPPAPAAVLRADGAERWCVLLPEIEHASRAEPVLVIVELAPDARTTRKPSAAGAPGPIRFHVYAFGAGHWLIAGLERREA